jgi:DNA polymerase III delta subunit
MNLMELKKSLSEKKINKLYIFTGDEIAVMDIYIDKISKMFNGDVVNAVSLSSIVSRLKSKSLIFNNKSLFIIRDDKEVTSAEKIWDSLKKGTFQKDNTILLVYNNIDKRGKFYKEFAEYIVSFEPLSTEILLKYVNKDLQLSKDKAEYLIHICQNNYNKLLLEMDKVKCLAKNKNISDEQAFDMCVKGNAFYIPPEGEIFDLLNAVLNGNVNETYKQLQMFIKRGDSPLAIMSLLHTNLKAILQVQCVQGKKDITQITGLPYYQIKNTYQFLNMYSEEELIRMIRINRFCEKAIKQTGLIDQDMILDFMLVKIF